MILSPKVPSNYRSYEIEIYFAKFSIDSICTTLNSQHRLLSIVRLNLVVFLEPFLQKSKGCAKNGIIVYKYCSMKMVMIHFEWLSSHSHTYSA